MRILRAIGNKLADGYYLVSGWLFNLPRAARTLIIMVLVTLGLVGIAAIGNHQAGRANNTNLPSELADTIADKKVKKDTEKGLAKAEDKQQYVDQATEMQARSMDAADKNTILGKYVNALPDKAAEKGDILYIVYDKNSQYAPAYRKLILKEAKLKHPYQLKVFYIALESGYNLASTYYFTNLEGTGDRIPLMFRVKNGKLTWFTNSVNEFPTK